MTYAVVDSRGYDAPEVTLYPTVDAAHKAAEALEVDDPLGEEAAIWVVEVQTALPAPMSVGTVQEDYERWAAEQCRDAGR